MCRLFGRVLLVGIHAYAPFGGISAVANTSNWFMANTETTAAQQHFEQMPNKRPKNTHTFTVEDETTKPYQHMCILTWEDLKYSHIHTQILLRWQLAGAMEDQGGSLMQQPDRVHWQLGAGVVNFPWLRTGAAGSPELWGSEKADSYSPLFSLHPFPPLLPRSMGSVITPLLPEPLEV